MVQAKPILLKVLDNPSKSQNSEDRTKVSIVLLFFIGKRYDLCVICNESRSIPVFIFY
ncbi:MAG: hypothetical protein ACJAZM_001988 [Cyclobacteriaceae bacterium]|jgi:hypothetical protein